MKKTVFQYVVIQHPPKSEADQSIAILEGLQVIAAKDAESAKMEIVANLPERLRTTIDTIEILIRPF